MLSKLPANSGIESTVAESAITLCDGNETKLIFHAEHKAVILEINAKVKTNIKTVITFIGVIAIAVRFKNYYCPLNHKAVSPTFG